MDSAERIVKQINEILTSQDREAQRSAASIASDYADLCHEANQRLAQCVSMIKKGSDYQALQLAEAEPSLLDLVGLLSFSKLKDWLEYCKTEQLAIPEKIDVDGVKVLNALYAKGISPNHPLYKDYRAAVSSRDDAKALHIIKSIVRLNPGDENAKQELARLENKLFQLRLKDLKAALATGVDRTIADSLEELERVAPASRLMELTEYGMAVQHRSALQRRAAEAQALLLINQLSMFQAEGNWRQVGEALSRISALEKNHQFTLPPENDVRRMEAESYFEENQKRFITATRFEEALQSLAEMVATVDSRFATRAGRKLEVMEEDYLVLNKRWRDVEAFGFPVAEDLQIQVRRVAGALKNEISRLKKGRQLTLGSVGLVAAVVLITSGWLVWDYIQAQSYRNELERLVSAKQLASTEKLIASLTRERAKLAETPILKAKITEAEAWAREQRENRQDLDRALSQLEEMTSQGFEHLELVPLLARMESLAQRISSLPEELGAPAARRLDEQRNRFDDYLNKQRVANQQELAKLIDTLESEAVPRLGLDRTSKELAEALVEYGPTLARISELCSPPAPALPLAESLKMRAAALLQRAESCRAEIDILKRGREEMLSATTLEAYKEALAPLRHSSLAQSDEVKAARRVLLSFPEPDSFLMSLLMPGDPVGWATLNNEKGKFIPGDVLPGEVSKLLALRDDENLRRIWEISVVNHENSAFNRTIYSREELGEPSSVGQTDRVRRTWVGVFYDPKKNPDVTHFAQYSYFTEVFPSGGKRYEELSNCRRSLTSISLDGLYLSYMTDEEGEKYLQSILKVFDTLASQKDANALYRLFVFQRLKEFTMVRPYAWGLQFCTPLKADFEAVEKILAEMPVRSGDWMVPRRNQLAATRVKSFIANLNSRNYLKQAQLHHALVNAIRSEKLRFGGFLDLDGRVHLLGEASGQNEVWAVGENGEPVLLVKKEDQFTTNGAVPFSPVFFVPGDRLKLLSDTAKKIGISIDNPGVRDHLPPFFQSYRQ